MPAASATAPALPFSWRPVLLTAAALIAALGIAGLDLASRARAAYRRAERLERLARRPAERAESLSREFMAGVEALDRRRPSAPEREIEVDVLRKRWEERRLRSAWTEAYHAWRDVYDLYAPPETRWSRRARLMAPACRQRWREEWTARGLPFQESFLDLEPGEEGGYRLLYSTPDGRDASRALRLLQAADVPAKLFPAAADLPPGAAAARLLVPEDRFWEAHEALLPLVGLDENW